MNDDDRLAHLLRAALPPANAAGPSRDLWPRVASRLDARVRVSWQMQFAVPMIPIGMGVYYLAWKYLVLFLNEELGIG
jgi:hypothetical protein